MKGLRRYKRPNKRVLISGQKITHFSISEVSSFHRLLTDKEQQFILSQDGKRTLFNGSSVRLDSIIGDTANLSVVGFFDFMTTNLVVKPASRAKRSAFWNLYSNLFSDQVKEVRKLEHRVKTAILGQPLSSFSDVLAVNELANIITVSVLLEDSAGNVLLVHRGNKVAISSGNFAVSCAGSVSTEDLREENPFLACARRELMEELNLQCDLQVDSIVISKQKLQPAVLINGKVDCLFQDVYTKMISAPDFREENTELYAVPKTIVSSIVKKHQFTDVAAYQLVRDKKWWAFVIPRSIKRYQLR